MGHVGDVDIIPPPRRWQLDSQYPNSGLSSAETCRWSAGYGWFFRYLSRAGNGPLIIFNIFNNHGKSWESIPLGISRRSDLCPNHPGHRPLCRFLKKEMGPGMRLHSNVMQCLHACRRPKCCGLDQFDHLNH